LGSTCHDPGPVGGEVPSTVTVRGPGNAAAGYCAVQTASNPVQMNGATRATGTHTYQVVVPPQPAISNANLIVKVDGVTTLSVPLSQLVSAGYSGPTITSVRAFRVAISANTGNVYGNNEIYDVNVRPAAALQLTQTTREGSFSHLGQITHYRFLLTNIGTEPLDDLHVDYHRGGTFNKHDLTCPRIWLQPGKTVACTAWHRVTGFEMKGRRVRDTMYAWGFTHDRRDVKAPSHGGTMKYRDAADGLHGHHLG
jgi:hypothetical protein